jgi:Protein of unknown function (DUF2569)
METTEPGVKAAQDRPPQVDHLVVPRGLGGWLVLVAIGIVVTPFRLVWDIYSNFAPILQDGSLSTVLDPSSPSYVNFLGPLLFIEAAVNIVTILWSIYAGYLFFSTKRRFPRNYQFFLVSNLIIQFLDPVMAGFVLPEIESFDTATVKSIAQSFIGCAIWIPYLAISKRVKNTFIK